MNPTLIAKPISGRLQNLDAERWLEALPVACLGVDPEERIRIVNMAATDLFAGMGRGLLGRRLADVFGADAPIPNLVRRARRAMADVAESEVALAGPGFTLGRASVAVAPVGEAGHMAIVFHRLGRPRSAAHGAQLNVAGRTLAHEVRNPLAGIRAAAQLIARSDDTDVSGLAALICAEVDRIHRLTDRIDPFGAIDAPRFEPFNIHEALERVRKIVGPSAPDLMIRERYDPSLPLVRGDPDQLIQAFLNIAKNAAEALAGRSDGEISIVTSYRPGVRVRAAPDAAARAQLEVQIADNGPGIHPDIAERLFEAFATTKSSGMGLGLTVAAEIIARHEGRIEVDSKPGRTAFRVLLPIAHEDAP
jgi:two-component system, NtrC family, nitrogen regulation sensor histidine kinase GlnL